MTGCGKSYGSEGTLSQHYKTKHNSLMSVGEESVGDDCEEMERKSMEEGNQETGRGITEDSKSKVES